MEQFLSDMGSVYMKPAPVKAESRKAVWPERQADWICKGSDRRRHDVLSDGSRYRRKVPQSGIRNHFDGSDHEREWAPVWNAAYKRCKSLL